MRYGLPYQGSKNDIAQWVIDHLPPADVLIDAFAGGCAITHCAMLSHKFKRVIANDINDIPQLFVDAINGKYRNESRWISREDFFALKDTDPYVRVCWSFGNDGKTYMYSKEVEPYKKAFHYAIMFQDYTLFESMGVNLPIFLKQKCKGARGAQERRLFLMRWFKKHTEEVRAMLQGVDMRDDQLSRPMHLERIEEVQSLERLQGDYSQIPLPKGESYVIYCDPPYKNTDCGHYKGFDHDRFYNWLRTFDVPVLISEYTMPSDFREVDVVTKQVKLNSDSPSKGAERLFCHESTIDKLPKTTLF